MKQNRIQDLKRFEEQIFDVIQDYLDNTENYPINAALVINNFDREIDIDINNEYPKCATYKIEHLLRSDEDGNIEPDVDTINELASKYYFAR